MSDPENINSTQYHISQRDFVLLKHLKIKLPNGQITNFDWDKTYIVNAVEGNGRVVNIEDTDSQYINIDDTLRFREYGDNPDTESPNDKQYSVSVFNLSSRFEAGSNITINPIAVPNPNSPEYYKLTISATDTTYKADNRITQLTGATPQTFTLKPGNVGQILSTNNNSEVVWTTPPNYSTSDTQYGDGRYINVGTTKIDGKYPISCTLSADNKTIQINDNILNVKAGDNGQILSTNAGSAVWVTPPYSLSDTTYSLEAKKENNITKLILNQNNSPLNTIPIKGNDATSVNVDTNGNIIIDSHDTQPIIYYADNNPEDENDKNTLKLTNDIKFSVYDIHTRLSGKNQIEIGEPQEDDDGVTTISITPATTTGQVLKTFKNPTTNKLYVGWGNDERGESGEPDTNTEYTGGQWIDVSDTWVDGKHPISCILRNSNLIYIKDSGQICISGGNVGQVLMSVPNGGGNLPIPQWRDERKYIGDAPGSGLIRVIDLTPFPDPQTQLMDYPNGLYSHITIEPANSSVVKVLKSVSGDVDWYDEVTNLLSGRRYIDVTEDNYIDCTLSGDCNRPTKPGVIDIDENGYITIKPGSNNQVLKTDSNGKVYWGSDDTGGGGTCNCPTYTAGSGIIFNPDTSSRKGINLYTPGSGIAIIREGRIDEVIPFPVSASVLTGGPNGIGWAPITTCGEQ